VAARSSVVVGLVVEVDAGGEQDDQEGGGDPVDDQAERRILPTEQFDAELIRAQRTGRVLLLTLREAASAA
jgi:hypothetical protein